MSGPVIRGRAFAGSGGYPNQPAIQPALRPVTGVIDRSPKILFIRPGAALGLVYPFTPTLATL
ncbi:hypothetical protein GCM10022406_39000 [Hymenobacter algoricola]|uniref:Uncharacterized protein n=1 Tax=Hymenobacter algoricola TaxID=486267 RepID=A0ABP7NSX7_9BACT